MECPHCKKELRLGEIPELHMERYGKTVSVATECCGKGVVCQPYLAFSVRKYQGNQLEDDWGTPYSGG